MSFLSLQDIRLKPAVLKAVEKKARHAGKTPAEYVRTLIERALLADQSFDDILRPVRADFARSGITEAELEQTIGRARKAARPAVRSGRRNRR